MADASDKRLVALEIGRTFVRDQFEADLRRVRFYTGANAGGVLATLGIIGSLLRLGGYKPTGFPVLLYWALIGFFIGFAGCWVVFANFKRRLRNARERDVARVEEMDPIIFYLTDGIVHFIGMALALAGALTGIVLGMIVLYQFAR